MQNDQTNQNNRNFPISGRTMQTNQQTPYIKRTTGAMQTKQPEGYYIKGTTAEGAILAINVPTYTGRIEPDKGPDTKPCKHCLVLPSGSLTTVDAARGLEKCWALESVTLPDSVTSIGSNIFRDCKFMNSLTLPKNLTSIGDDAFHACTGLVSVTFPDTLTSIGAESFRACYGIKTLSLPNGLTSIGDCAFYDCSSLTSLTLPETLQRAGDLAFGWCTQLTVLKRRLPPRGSLPFIVWAIGQSRNRANWQLTIMLRMRNVLRLIAVLSFEGPREVPLDPDEIEGDEVFLRVPR